MCHGDCSSCVKPFAADKCSKCIDEEKYLNGTVENGGNCV